MSYEDKGKFRIVDSKAADSGRGSPQNTQNTQKGKTDGNREGTRILLWLDQRVAGHQIPSEYSVCSVEFRIRPCSPWLP
jgi:hypothetical protein